MSWTPPDLRRRPTIAPPHPEATPGSSRWRADAAVALLTAAMVVLLGAPAGLLWSALAPHAHVLASPPAPATVPDGGTEVFIAGDGWFVGVTLLLGLVTGVLAWLLARRAGPFVVVALLVGGLAASYVASRVGVRVGQDALRAFLASGRAGTVRANVALQATATIVVWPLGALAAFGALVLSRVDELD